RLDAHEPVLDDVDAADPLGAGAPVGFFDRLQRGDGDAVDRHGDAFLEGDDDFILDRGEGRIIGVGVHVLGRRVPDVFEVPGFDRPAPHVLVDGERVGLGRLDRQAVLLGVLDRFLAGEREVAHGGDAVEVGREGGDSHFEAHLVVAFAGAAVGDGGRAELAGGLHEVLDDDGPAQGGHERVGVHVQRVRLERGHDVFVRELITGIRDVGLYRPAVQRALADDVEVFPALAHVDGDGDDLRTGCFTDPTNRHRGVEPSGVGQYDAVFTH